MTYITPPLAVAGQPLPAADWNAKVRSSMEVLAKPPRIKVTRVTTQSIPNAVATEVAFTALEYVGASGFAWNGSGQLTVSGVSGWYNLNGIIQWANGGSATQRRLDLWTNGAGGIVDTDDQIGTAGTYQRQRSIVDTYLTTGTVILLRAYQATGGALDIIKASLSARLVAI